MEILEFLKMEKDSHINRTRQASSHGQKALAKWQNVAVKTRQVMALGAIKLGEAYLDGLQHHAKATQYPEQLHCQVLLLPDSCRPPWLRAVDPTDFC